MVSTATNKGKKRRGTSLPLLIGLVILGIVGYYSGPTIMTYAFYLQESIIAGSGKKGGDLPMVVTPDTSGDPNVGAGPYSSGPGPSGPGGGGPSEGGTSGEAVAPSNAETNSGDVAPAEAVAK